MQSVSNAFAERAQAAMRKLKWRAFMSFERNFDASIDFFTIGTSLIGGTDIIKGEGDVVQEWDKYDYQEVTDRIVMMQVTRSYDPVSSVSLAMADVVLENHDDYLTPGRGSAIADYILPYRPMKLYMGFNEEVIPQFTGITEKMPVINDKAKLAIFHGIGFLYSLFNRPLDESVMLENVSTDSALDTLLQLAGLTSNQYNLDTGFNLIAFVYFPKGTKLKDAITELMVAEMGRVYMDELGVIQFKNRQNYATSPVYVFEKFKNIVDFKTKKQDDIYNVVEIKAKVREVQANQKFWELQKAIKIEAGTTVEIWADFDDPVTACDDPNYIVGATTSLFSVNTKEDGTGDVSAVDVTLDSGTLFAQSFKMVFDNAGSVSYYITAVELFATPAKVVKEIYVREEDAASIAKYDERVLTIENDFFNTEDIASSKAQILLADYATFGEVYEMEVKGTFALQLNDPISVEIDGKYDIYVIRKIQNTMQNGKFTQLLTIQKKVFDNYFTIGESLVGGDDKIAP